MHRDTNRGHLIMVSSVLHVHVNLFRSTLTRIERNGLKYHVMPDT